MRPILLQFLGIVNDGRDSNFNPSPMRTVSPAAALSTAAWIVGASPVPSFRACHVRENAPNGQQSESMKETNSKRRP
jgi:hypothetical protein